MQVKTVLRRYYDEHVTYITTDYPRIFLIAERHLNSVLGRKHLADVSDADTRKRYADYRRKGHKAANGRTWPGASDATIRRELGVLVAAAVHGRERKWLTAADMPIIILPDSSPEKDVWLEKAEALRLVEEAWKMSWRCGLFVTIGLFTGARPSRIRYLKWERVDMKRAIIDFRDDNDDPKSKKKYTRVRMMDELKPYMVDAFKRRNEEGRGPYWVLGCTTDLDYQFAQAVKNAGLEFDEVGQPRQITPNTLRHTWATWSAMDGVDLYMIARVLGNTVKTVERRYAHWHPSYQTEAIERSFFGEGNLEQAVEAGRA